MFKFLFPVCFFLSQVINSQVVFPPLLKVGSLKPLSIEFEKKKSALPGSFSSFAIKDVRQDSTTAGYIRFTQEPQKYFRLEFEKGTNSAAQFLNNYFVTTPGTDSSRQIIALKHFFITQDYQSPSSFMSLANVVYISKVFVTARLMIQKGERYYYLGEADTVIAFKKWLGKSYNQLAQIALLHIIDKAERLLKEESLKTVRYDEFIAASYQNKFDINNLKQGIYSSYADFLSNQKANIEYHFEQGKKVRVLKPLSAADTIATNNCRGMVDNGVLHVRNGGHYVPLKASFGSMSGLGLCFFELNKIPIVGLLTANPLSFAVDMADMAISAPTAKVGHYKLFTLNFQTGELE